MKIVRLSTENVKRLSAVHITPDGSMVVIGGENGAGKTSVLDSIWYALGGKGALPGQPVRKGEKRAKVTLDLGEMIVVRTITPDGGGSLKVTSKEGATFPSPQTMLDKLVGILSFDPLAFARLPAKEQAETLRKLAGLDFAAQDGQRRTLYEQRTEVNRDVSRLDAQLAGLPFHADAEE
ncbi:MAG: AAA family ATPase, partial [Elusimicrobia bacterium]|nr:AAA family ATPase [Elusimicrobiota bacterium]